jgi:uncharacterized membrane protein YkoI
MRQLHMAPAARRAAPGAVMLAAVAALWLAGLTVARAGDEDDHDRARAAVQAGEVLPLATLLERLQRSHPGQVMELELEREDGRWIYEVKLLQADGQLLKLELDARTAQVLKLRRKSERKEEHKEKHKSGDAR